MEDDSEGSIAYDPVSVISETSLQKELIRRNGEEVHLLVSASFPCLLLSIRRVSE